MRQIAAVLIVMLGLAMPARADVVSADFTIKNFSNANVTSPLATLTITGDGAVDGVVTFDLKVDAPNSAYLNKLGFNTSLDSDDFALGSVLIGDAGATLDTGHFQLDGFGKYEVVFNNHQPGSSSGTAELKWTVNVLNGQAALASKFLEVTVAANDPGHFFYAIDYFPTTGATGFAGDGPCDVPSPEPATLTMAAVGIFCGLGAWWRKRSI